MLKYLWNRFCLRAWGWSEYLEKAEEILWYVSFMCLSSAQNLVTENLEFLTLVLSFCGIVCKHDQSYSFIVQVKQV